MVGDAALDRALRYFTFAVILGIALALPQEGAQLFLGSPKKSYIDITTNPWAFPVMALALCYLTTTAGAAWARSSGPILRMASSFILDTDTKYVRLPFYNDGGQIAEPEVSVVEIFDDNGDNLNTAGPFELHWTHHLPPTRARISYGDPDKTVGVISAHQPGIVRFEGMLYKREVTSTRTDGSPRIVYFKIRALMPGQRSFIESLASITPNAAEPLGFLVTTIEAPKLFRKRRPPTIPAPQPVSERGFFEHMRDAHRLPEQIRRILMNRMMREFNALTRRTDVHLARRDAIDRRGGTAWAESRIVNLRQAAKDIERYCRRIDGARVPLENASAALGRSYEGIVRFLRAHPHLARLDSVVEFRNILEGMATSIGTARSTSSSYRDSLAGLHGQSTEMNHASDVGVAIISGLIRALNGLENTVREAVKGMDEIRGAEL